MIQITWTTKTGKIAMLQLITSKIVSADGDTVERACWDLVASCYPLYMHSPSIRNINGISFLSDNPRRGIAIPDDKLEEVISLVNKYRTESDQRFAQMVKSERDHEQSQIRLHNAMTINGTSY